MNFEDYARKSIVNNPDYISIHRTYNDLSTLFKEGLYMATDNITSTSAGLIDKENYASIVNQMMNHRHGDGKHLVFLDIPQELGFKINDLNNVIALAGDKNKYGGTNELGASFVLPPKYILGYFDYEKFTFTPNPYYAFYREDPNREKSIEEAKEEMQAFYSYSNGQMSKVDGIPLDVGNIANNFNSNPLYEEIGNAIKNKGENDKLRIVFNIPFKGDTNCSYSMTTTNVANETHLIVERVYQYNEIRGEVLENIAKGVIDKSPTFNEDVTMASYIMTTPTNIDLALHNFPEAEIDRVRRAVIGSLANNKQTQPDSSGGRMYHKDGFASALILALVVGFECGIAFIILLNQIK